MLTDGFPHVGIDETFFVNKRVSDRVVMQFMHPYLNKKEMSQLMIILYL